MRAAPGAVLLSASPASSGALSALHASHTSLEARVADKEAAASALSADKAEVEARRQMHLHPPPPLAPVRSAFSLRQAALLKATHELEATRTAHATERGELLLRVGQTEAQLAEALAEARRPRPWHA